MVTKFFNVTEHVASVDEAADSIEVSLLHLICVSQLQEMGLEYGERNSAFGAATGSSDHIRTAVMRGTLRETDIFRSWTEITSHSKWSSGADTGSVRVALPLTLDTPGEIPATAAPPAPPRCTVCNAVVALNVHFCAVCGHPVSLRDQTLPSTLLLLQPRTAASY